MKKILSLILPISLLISCTEDRFELQETTMASALTPITYSVSGVETRASLIESTDDLEDQAREIFVYAIQDDKVYFQDSFNLDDMKTTGNYYWNGRDITFYAFPNDGYGMSFDTPTDDALTFTGTVGVKANSTPDHLIARTVAKEGEVSFELKHVFTAVNVVYKHLDSGHRISSVKLKNMYTSGTCTFDDNGIVWSDLSTSADMYDDNGYGGNQINYVTRDGQDILRSDCKFMTIPGQTINLEVVIDGITVTKTCEPKNAGDYVTFYIEDDYSISTDGVVDNGYLTYEDGNYTLTLDTYVTGKETVETAQKISNSVLLLDTSGSMDDAIIVGDNMDRGLDKLDKVKGATEGYYRAYVTGLWSVLRDVRWTGSEWQYKNKWSGWESILDADYDIEVYSDDKINILKKACTNYVNSMYATGEHHLITIIEYASRAYRKCTQLDVQDNKQKLLDIIDDFEAGGGTYIDEAFEDLLGTYKESDKNAMMSDLTKYYNSVLVVTDGSPGDGDGLGKGETSNQKVANAAINYANTCKSTYDADVYVVGIFETIEDDCNGFLDRLSSNYKDATTFTDGTKTASTYYSLASSEDAFVSTIEAITTEIIENSLDYDGMPYIYFTFSDAMYYTYILANTKFYEVTQTGYNSESKKPTFKNSTPVDITSSIEFTCHSYLGDHFTVKGFDYAANYCGEGRVGKGKKLMMVIPGLWGGLEYEGTGWNQVFNYGSGLYEGSTGNIIQDFSSVYINL